MLRHMRDISASRQYQTVSNTLKSCSLKDKRKEYRKRLAAFPSRLNWWYLVGDEVVLVSQSQAKRLTCCRTLWSSQRCLIWHSCLYSSSRLLLTGSTNENWHVKVIWLPEFQMKYNDPPLRLSEIANSLWLKACTQIQQEYRPMN